MKNINKQDEAVQMAKRWNWKMNWCRNNLVSPANPYWWRKADKEYNKYVKKMGENIRETIS